MKSLFVALIAVLALGGAAAAQDIAGDWQGTLNTGGAQLHMVLHLTRGADGALHATMDSLDQGAYGIPVADAIFKNGSLSLDVPAVHGSYEGEVNPAATKISGTLTQGQPLALDWERAQAAPAARPKPSAVDGIWLGTLDTGAIKLRVAFHISTTESGLKATMDSLDQGANGIPVSEATLDGSTLTLKVEVAHGNFTGTVSADGETIDGQWSQSGASLPLRLKRTKDEAALKKVRPQEPKRPYPYDEEEVSFRNELAGINLAGTLTVPRGVGRHPAVVLITGSGPQNRDEEIMGHRPFLVLADYLTRHGIAVLRVDDRGVGKSGGKFAGATTADFATDAEAALAWLKTRQEIDAHHIGVLGHSEGGAIAPMVAARSIDIAFVVMLAGPGVPGDQIIPQQVLRLAEAAGVSHEVAEKNVQEERELLAIVEKEKDDAVAEKKLRERLAGKMPQGQMDAQLKAVLSPWYRYFLTYDPRPALRKLKCPVLALNGSLDTQVDAQQNLPEIRKALEEGGNKSFEVVEMPGLNHLLQTAKTGSPNEYGEIEETMALAALDKIATWVLAHTR